MEKKEMFIEKLRSIFGEKAEAIVAEISKSKKYFSFRVNTLCANKVDLDLQAFEGPFENTYFCNAADKEKISRTFDNGEIYIQSFSSMLAVRNLGAKFGDTVLDMCAAPGGKSAYAAALANNEISLIALDNNIGRVNAMKQNFTTLGVKNFEVKKMDASRAQSDPTMINRFDKIIVDVPCSNEGLMRIGENNFEYWNPKHSKHLPMLQKKILASALNCLKPGGIAVYSTCTFSPEENEEVIAWALQKFPDVELVKVETEQVPTIDGFIKWKNKEYGERLALTKRILPDEKFDGFFIAKLLRRN